MHLQCHISIGQLPIDNRKFVIVLKIFFSTIINPPQKKKKNKRKNNSVDAFTRVGNAIDFVGRYTIILSENKLLCLFFF